MSPAQLRQTATHVVVGTVEKISTRKEKTGDREITHYVATVRINAVEKGEGLMNGELVQVRYWTQRWLGGRPEPGTAGHRGLPKQKETFRIYLARNAYDGFGETKDGGFNVVGANGFERIEPAAKK